jgi:antitoxin MazE5
MPEAGPETAGGADRPRGAGGPAGAAGRSSPSTGAVSVAFPCYAGGMARQRVSTTVDADLLAAARALRPWRNDATLLDAALDALVARHRSADIDAAYRAYDEVPLDAADEWGDLASFRSAAGSS